MSLTPEHVIVRLERGAIAYRGHPFRRLAQNFHFAASVLLGLALFPLLYSLNLPRRFDWPLYFQTYWVGLALQSIFFAALLCLIGFPLDQTLRPMWRRYSRQKARLVFLVPLVALLVWLDGPVIALILCVDALAFIEVMDRVRERQVGLSRAGRAVFVPAAYLFLGLTLVFVYNDIVASVRFFGAFDGFFNRMDTWLLRGGSVSSIAHWASGHLSVRVLQFLEIIYFGMFPQIGAGIILIGVASGQKRALKFIGTILTAYYLALLVFYLWPSHGPYYLCASHFQEFPKILGAYHSQRFLLAHARAAWEHTFRDRIGLDYFIAFPCMHIVQPLIVLWYLRKWKRIVGLLVGMDLLIVVSILVLEWHYVVDLIGGVIVASVAIAMVDGWGGERQPEELPPPGAF